MAGPRSDRSPGPGAPVAPPADAAPGSGRLREILDVAARIFNERGYEGTTTASIAQEVGLLKGSLYHYIESKEDLLYQLLSEVHRRLIDGVEECLDPATDPLDRLRLFVERHFVRVAENVDRAALFYRDFRSLGPARQAELVAARDRYEALLRSLVTEGQRAGLLSARADPKLTAMAILSALNSIHLWYRPDAGRPPAELARHYADLLLGGLTCRPAGHAHLPLTVPGRDRTDRGLVDLSAAEGPALIDLTDE